LAGISLSLGFNLNSPVPIDSRNVFQLLTDRDAMPTVQRYEGLVTYVKETQKYYYLIGGTDNTHWVEQNANTTFVYTQPSPSATWIITHNLNKYVTVTIVDSAENVVIGDVVYNSLNQITVSFSGGFSGTAYIN
jgi:hypothetical protein